MLPILKLKRDPRTRSIIWRPLGFASSVFLLKKNVLGLCSIERSLEEFGESA